MNETNIIDFYDSIAENEAREWYNNESLLPTIKEFLTFFHSKPKILDLGCGTGHEAKRLSRLGAEVTGIDFSSNSIEIAKYKTPECSFIELNFSNIDESLGSFDGIFSAGSLIHIPIDELNISLKQIISVLKDNGYFLAILQEGENNFIHYPEVNGKKIERILYRFTNKEILDCFQNADMSFIKEAFLMEEFLQFNWKAYIFQKNKRQF